MNKFKQTADEEPTVAEVVAWLKEQGVGQEAGWAHDDWSIPIVGYFDDESVFVDDVRFLVIPLPKDNEIISIFDRPPPELEALRQVIIEARSGYMDHHKALLIGAAEQWFCRQVTDHYNRTGSDV